MNAIPSSMRANVRLKRGKEKPILRGHPWVFSGAIASLDREVEPGTGCAVCDAGGTILGHGYYNPHASIAVRMLTRGNTLFTGELLRRRLEKAAASRASILADDTSACRLVNSEGDFIPGLIVDRYGDGLCIQITTAGMERWREAVLSHLDALIKPSFVYERSDAEERAREQCEPRNRCGPVQGRIPAPLHVLENGIRYLVDLAAGQKTGMFLDQRENRRLFRHYAAERVVADCFAYTGGFSLNALAGGARAVRSIDASVRALDWAKENRRLNGYAAPDADFVDADVFDFLRNCTDRYSMVVLDPPKFARSSRDVPKACRGYKDINLVSMRNMEPGGILFTFSCSQAIDTKLFRQVVFAAAADSGRDVQLLHVLSQPPDHPVNVSHREGEYLKGLVLRVL
ncbi:MAG: hypothetical protein GF418_11095 [Chitinivibrionales bacterium]|nr:hypothetical protein [Chitinivibrionales bacterium]MBD3396161.1 hypothetical protein [Chitinivibrionales bacterium]